MAGKMVNATLENAQIMWRNLSGEAKRYNAEGDRNFVIFLDDDLAAQMAADGWKIDETKPTEQRPDTQKFIKVKVSFKGRPPQIMLITSKGKTPLNEDLAGIIDYADIESADVILNPYHWDVNGKQGVTAYLNALWVKIRENELDLKYQDLEEVSLSNPRQRLEIESGQEPADLGELRPIDAEPIY